jgi:hypothetical protein
LYRRGSYRRDKQVLSSGTFQWQLALLYVPLSLRDIDEEAGGDFYGVPDVYTQKRTLRGNRPGANCDSNAAGTIHLISTCHI